MLGLFEKWMTAVVWASSEQEMTAAELRVLVHLLQRQNPSTGQCNPSAEQLAKDANCTTRTVYDVTKKLREKGAIDWSRPTNSSSNSYIFPDAERRIKRHLGQDSMKPSARRTEVGFPYDAKRASHKKEKKKERKEKAASQAQNSVSPKRNRVGGRYASPTKSTAALQAAFVKQFPDSEKGWTALMCVEAAYYERVEMDFRKGGVTLDQAVAALVAALNDEE